MDSQERNKKKIGAINNPTPTPVFSDTLAHLDFSGFAELNYIKVSYKTSARGTGGNPSL